MKTVLDKELNRCKCGGKGRYRYGSPVHWVECRNKRCEQRTRYYSDLDEQLGFDAKQRAIDEWNQMMK